MSIAYEYSVCVQCMSTVCEYSVWVSAWVQYASTVCEYSMRVQYASTVRVSVQHEYRTALRGSHAVVSIFILYS
jgi:hypothetical protein